MADGTIINSAEVTTADDPIKPASDIERGSNWEAAEDAAYMEVATTANDEKPACDDRASEEESDDDDSEPDDLEGG